ncbi:hypothetical protein AWC28_01115 [Mycolicibacter terrae]|nr:hypothetical protein AWC28_01115 [Mycolicibacter terrae]
MKKVSRINLGSRPYSKKRVLIGTILDLTLPESRLSNFQRRTRSFIEQQVTQLKTKNRHLSISEVHSLHIV